MAFFSGVRSSYRRHCKFCSNAEGIATDMGIVITTTTFARYSGFWTEEFTLEDFIGSHSCSLEVLPCVQSMTFL
jgi:hypothetical protein